MAEAVAATIAGEEQHFTGADMSTKLKLMGVDVASFGRYSGFKVRQTKTAAGLDGAVLSSAVMPDRQANRLTCGSYGVR